jgi:hypothetical protein
MEATADRVRLPLVTVLMLIVAPLIHPLFWLVGVAILAVERPPGWKATVAMCPLGLLAPLWLYGNSAGDGATLPTHLGVPAAVALTAGCLLAAWRVTR